MYPYFGSSTPDDRQESELAFWLEKAAPEDPEILRVLVEKYGREVHRLVYALLWDERAGAPQEGEVIEIVQDTFARAIADLSAFRGQESVRSWLYGLTLRASRRKRKRLGLRNWRARKASPAGRAGETQARIWASVNDLDEKTRLALLLRYIFRLTIQEIARTQGDTPIKVHERLAAARDRWVEQGGEGNMRSRAVRRAHSEIRRLIQAKHDGLIENEPDALSRLREHLGGCEPCRSYADEIDRLEGTLSAAFQAHWAGLEPGDLDQGELLTAVRTERVKIRPLRRLSAYGFEAFLMLGVLLVVLALGSFFRRQDTHTGVPLFPVTPDPTPTLFQASGAQAKVVSIPERDDPHRSEFGYYIDPSISADGRWIVFSYYVNSVVAGETVPRSDVLIFDREAGEMRRVDLAAEGDPARVINFSPEISADGTWIVFVSNAGRFSNDAEGTCVGGQRAVDCTDVYLLDRRTGEVERISSANGGGWADSASWGPSISANGRWITFWSAASNLGGPGQEKCDLQERAKICWDVFLYDREKREIDSVLIGRWFWEYEALSLERVPVSDDGRWLAITLHADDQVAGAQNMSNQRDVYVYDRQRGAFEPVNVAQDGAPGKGPSSHAVMSSDGRIVGFASLADNLVPGDANRWGDVFVRDRVSGSVEHVSATTHGGQSNGNSGAFFSESGGWGQEIDMSLDGRYITFISAASNLVSPVGAPCSDVNWVPCLNVYLHDRSTGKTEVALPGVDHSFSYLSPEISGDGRWVSVVRQDVPCLSAPVCSTVMLYDREAGGALSWISGNKPLIHQVYSAEWRSTAMAQESYGGANSVVFSPDGELLTSGTNDGSVRLIRIPEGQVFKTFQVHTSPVTSVVFSPDGKLLASGSHDGRVVVYGMEDGKLRAKVQGHGGAVLSLAFSPDGKVLSVGASGATWNLEIQPETYATLDHYGYPGGQVHSLAYSPDGRLLALGHKDGSIWLQRVSDGKILLRLAAHQDKILSLDFSPDGGYLAAGSADANVTFWRIEWVSVNQLRAENLFVFQHADWVNDLAFSPDGSLLVVASYGSGVRFWSVPGGELLSTVLGERYFQAVSLDVSPDGKSLVVGSSWGGITLWERILP